MKKTIRAEIRTLDCRPRPNQMMNRGPRASLGRPFRPVIRGISARLTRGEIPNPSPARVPSTPPKRRPNPASCPVVERCRASRPLETMSTNSCHSREGRLKKNSLTCPPAAATSHKTSRPRTITSVHTPGLGAWDRDFIDRPPLAIGFPGLARWRAPAPQSGG